jgi:hypothetical protein
MLAHCRSEFAIIPEGELPDNVEPPGGYTKEEE